MGRKLQGAALRAKKRGIAASLEIEAQKAVDVENAAVSTTVNEDLFVLDTSGDGATNIYNVNASANLAKKKKKKMKKGELSALDQQKVAKILARHNAKQLQSMVHTDEEKMKSGKRYRNKVKKRKQQTTYDLWGEGDNTTNNEEEEEEEDIGITRNKNRFQHISGITLKHEHKNGCGGGGGARGGKKQKKKQKKGKNNNDDDENKVAVDVAHSGQSYNPDPTHYHDVINKAIHIEKSRQQAIEKKNEPLATGLSEETKAMMVGESGSDDDDSGSDSEAEEDPTTLILRKKRKLKNHKLTQSELNRLQRIRQEQAAIEKQRKNKKFLKSIGNISRIKKGMKVTQKQLIEKRAEVEKSKEQEKLENGYDGTNLEYKMSKINPIHTPTLPVFLTAPTASIGGLRVLQPKGDLITERMASYTDRKMIAKRKKGVGNSDQQLPINHGKKRKVKVYMKSHTKEKIISNYMKNTTVYNHDL